MGSIILNADTHFLHVLKVVEHRSTERFFKTSISRCLLYRYNAAIGTD